MWKKDDRMDDFPTPQPDRTPQRSAPPPQSAAPTPSYPSGRHEVATIGRSITFKGDVTGDEDLTIQGRIEGSVELPEHSVTVGPDGEVMANIVARLVTVEGRVEGNIDGGEQVILRTSALVKGDITAPRVVLEDGARFRGLVDMGSSDVNDQAIWTGVGARGGDARKGTSNGKAPSPSPAAGDPGRSGDSDKAVSEPGRGETMAASDRSSGSSDSSNKGSSSASASASGKGRKPNDAEAQITI